MRFPRGGFYQDFISADGIQVKRMKWLTRFVLNIIGDINDVADRPYTDGTQAFLQPFREGATWMPVMLIPL